MPVRDEAVPEQRQGRLLRPLVKWLAVAAIWAVIALGGLVAWYGATLPDVDLAAAPTRQPSIRVLAADGRELATVGEYYGQAVAVADLPPALPKAVIATEDRRFYDHFGFDLIGIGRALVANLRAGTVVQGGSTITQQAAKNLFLTPERSLKRKFQEVLLALWLEQKFSKDQILAIYLNRAYFGAGAYGVDAAARKFFDRPATKVTTYQAALLAGLLKAPSRDNPISNPEGAQARTREVIARMIEVGYLTPADAKAALAQGEAASSIRRQPQIGRYFVDWVIAQIGQYAIAPDRDLLVRTTLDPSLQTLAEERVDKVLASAPAVESGVAQAAVVVLAPDGAVRAMVGGQDYWKSPFNRAASAYRQPGSAFKPIVYLAGLEAGLKPDSRFEDAPVRVAGWQPRNFTGRYRGSVTLTQAMAESINTVAVRVGEYAGAERIVDVARRLGVTADLRVTPSLSLGTSEISLVELTGAYASLANGGFGVWPYGIESIHDASGRALYVRSGSGLGRVLAPTDAAAVTAMLVQAVKSGTGRAANFGRPIAGKTGTSQNFRDAWFVGFSADLVAGVWVGNDDDTPMKSVTGGGLPAQLWRGIMAAAHAKLPDRPLPSLTQPPAAAPPPVVDEPREARAGKAHEPSLWDRLMRVFGG